MISLLRLEAEGVTLNQVVKDLDTAVRQLGPSCDGLNVHDEHYERVTGTCFKGRIVLKQGKKLIPIPLLATSGSATTATIRAA